MYKFYLGGVPLPVAPSKVQTVINGTNKTVTLINEGEVNRIKTNALTDISFECLIPQINKYPFAHYSSNNFKDARYYLSHFEKLKNLKKPFKFKISRKAPNNKILFDTNMNVTLEKYIITEDRKNGFDLIVSFELKQYREYGAKKAKLIKKPKEKDNNVIVITKPRKEKDIAKSYLVKKGDTLLNIAKQQLNDSTKWKDIYKLNESTIESAAKKRGKKSSSNGWWIFEGTILKLQKGGQMWIS